MADLPEPNFLMIVQLHQLQAMLHLGMVPDPALGRVRTPDPARARYEVELLRILREKTRGNLAEEEFRLLDDLVMSLDAALAQIESPRPRPQGGRRIVLPDEDDEQD